MLLYVTQVTVHGLGEMSYSSRVIQIITLIVAVIKLVLVSTCQ
jgi:hypothetical protein